MDYMICVSYVVGFVLFAVIAKIFIDSIDEVEKYTRGINDKLDKIICMLKKIEQKQ